MSAALRSMLQKRRLAEEAVAEILKRDYRIGDDVEWTVNGVHFGKVVMHGYGDRVKVENEKSGRQRWITAAQICEAMG